MSASKWPTPLRMELFAWCVYGPCVVVFVVVMSVALLVRAVMRCGG